MIMMKKKHRNESFESMFRRFKKLYEKSSKVKKRAREIAAKKEQKRQEDQHLKRDFM